MSTATEPEQPTVSGLLWLPEYVPGELSRVASKIVFDSALEWRVVGDLRTRLATVYDDKGEPVGWTEQSGKGIRQVVLPGGVKPAVFFEDKFFSRRVWMGDTAFKPVMMLEGRMRVWGDDRIRLEHRDFKSEVRFRCDPGMVIPAVLVAFEVYALPELHPWRIR